jgi:acyl-CoA synthetase (AMP-forming)/AMP-acid ligase II
MVNLSSFIFRHAERTPGRLAIIYGDCRISYADFYDRILHMAALLHDHDIKENDVVALVMKNSAAFLDIAFAVSHVGAILLPVNYRLAVAEIDYITHNAEARLIFADEEFSHLVDHDGRVVIINVACQSDSRCLVSSARPIVGVRPRTTQQLFRLMYTSGTTDRPKGVMHSYENFYWKCMSHVIELGLTNDDRLLVVGPLYHVGGFDMPGIAILWLGGSICLLRDFEPGDALRAIAGEGITGAWLAPVMVSRILTHPNCADYNVGTLRWVVGGGERTPEHRIHEFQRLFCNARYIDGFGLTESCSGDTLMEAGREIDKIGSTGRALVHVGLEIRDEDGALLPPNTPGEICLRGPKVTKGYWKDLEKTTHSFFGDWFRTGDVGYLDEEGFLFLTDRMKDMIISGGENIASSEIERVLFLLPQVADVAVVGTPDERWGEVPTAHVVLYQGSALDLEMIQAHCRTHLGGFKVPKHLILHSTLPRNPSGKVLKRLLREDCA